MLHEIPVVARQLPETAGKQDVIARQRRFREFFLENRSPAKLLKNPQWRERSNPSGVSLAHYLRIKNWQLVRLYHAIGAEGDKIDHHPGGDCEQLAEWLHLFDCLFYRYLEDWGIYVEPDGDFFITYIQNQVERCFENFDKSEIHAEIICGILERRDFPWARFAPMDYAETLESLVELCSMPLQKRAELKLGQRKASRKVSKIKNHRLIRNDFHKLDEIKQLCDPKRDRPVSIHADYLRDLLRFELLFFTDGDPLPDERWHSRCHDSPEAVAEAIADARRGLPPLLWTLPF